VIKLKAFRLSTYATSMSILIYFHFIVIGVFCKHYFLFTFNYRNFIFRKLNLRKQHLQQVTNFLSYFSFVFIWRNEWNSYSVNSLFLGKCTWCMWLSTFGRYFLTSLWMKYDIWGRLLGIHYPSSIKYTLVMYVLVRYDLLRSDIP